MGDGRGEGEEGSHFSRLNIPLPFVPSREGRGNSIFYAIINYIFNLLFELLSKRKSMARSLLLFPLSSWVRRGEC